MGLHPVLLAIGVSNSELARTIWQARKDVKTVRRYVKQTLGQRGDGLLIEHGIDTAGVEEWERIFETMDTLETATTTSTFEDQFMQEMMGTTSVSPAPASC